MSHRLLISNVILSAVVAILLVGSVAGQNAATKAPTSGQSWTPPKTPDGQPNLEGIWSNATLTPLERPKVLGTKEFYTDQEFAEYAKRARQGVFGEEADLGAANSQPLRYDLSLYGFDITKS